MSEAQSERTEESQSLTHYICCDSYLSEIRKMDQICDGCVERLLADEEDYMLSSGSDAYYESRF